MNSVPLAARANSDVIEAAYAQWLDNPDSVDPTWRAFFQGFTLGNSSAAPGAAPTSAAANAAGVRVVDSYKQAQLIRTVPTATSRPTSIRSAKNPPRIPSSPSPTSAWTTATSTRASRSRISKAAARRSSATSSAR